MNQTRAKMLKIVHKHKSTYGTLPTARQVADEYGCTPTRVRQVLTSDELGSGPSSWARVPKQEWSDAMQRLREIDAVLSKYNISTAEALERALTDRGEPCHS